MKYATLLLGLAIFMASTAAALSLCTIAVGVPRGMNNANQM